MCVNKNRVYFWDLSCTQGIKTIMPDLASISDLRINPSLVTVIKPAGKDKCTVFFAGQSAVDGGFLVNQSADEVTDIISQPQIRQSAEELLKALDAAWQPLNDLATWANEQGHPYSGTTFYQQTEDLRAALNGETEEENA